jgi:hypothetical protein
MWRLMIELKLIAFTEISYAEDLLMEQNDGLLVSGGFVRG